MNKKEHIKRKNNVKKNIVIGAVISISIIALVLGLMAKENYSDAKVLMQGRNYAQAQAKFEKLARFRYKDAAHLAEECSAELSAQYRRTSEYEKSGDFLNAYLNFSALGNYQDSAERALDTRTKLSGSILAGDTVYYGMFRGKVIQWRVLSVSDTSVLLLSAEPLLSAARPKELRKSNETHIYYEDTSFRNADIVLDNHDWSSGSVRQSLNGQYLETMFSTGELLMIDSVHTSAETTDRLFLPSEEEAEAFIPFDEIGITSSNLLGTVSAWLTRTYNGTHSDQSITGTIYFDGAVYTKRSPEFSSPVIVSADGFSMLCPGTVIWICPMISISLTGEAQTVEAASFGIVSNSNLSFIYPKGTVECPQCSGSGQFADDECKTYAICELCSGHGYIHPDLKAVLCQSQCSICEGKGETINWYYTGCSACNGTGKDQTKCSHCGGDGWIGSLVDGSKCDWCFGTGYASGLNRRKCGRCDGSGEIRMLTYQTCVKCFGKGFIYDSLEDGSVDLP